MFRSGHWRNASPEPNRSTIMSDASFNPSGAMTIFAKFDLPQLLQAISGPRAGDPLRWYKREVAGRLYEGTRGAWRPHRAGLTKPAERKSRPPEGERPE